MCIIIPTFEPVNRIRYYFVTFMELFYCTNKIGIKKEPIGLLPSAIYRLFTVRFQLFFGGLAPPAYLVIFKGYFKFKKCAPPIKGGY